MRLSFMKKLILAILVSIGLTSCVDSSDLKRVAGIPPSFTKQDFIGKWYCESSYSTWGAMTKEYYIFKPNGILENEGEMVVTNPNGAGELKYKYSVNAKWDLNGWDLVQVQTAKPKFKRMFDAKTKELLKKDEEFRLLDLGMEKLIFGQQQSASRSIVSVTPTEFTTKFNTSYEICSKVN